MRQKAAKQDTPQIPSLPPKYQTAVNAIAGGASITEAAQQSGLSRSRLSYAVNHNPAVYGELSRIRREMSAAYAAKVAGLMTRALDIVAAALEDEATPNRVNLALCVLSKIKPEPPEHRYCDMEDAVSKWLRSSPLALLEEPEPERVEKALVFHLEELDAG